MPRETSETTVSSTVRTSTPRADSMSPRDGHVPRRGLGVGRAVLVTLVAVVLVAPTLGQHVIATSDEARFPLLARDMMTRGVWFEAYVREKLFREKPPLYPWLIVIFSRPGGVVTETTAQAPVVLAAIATVLMTAQLGAALFGPAAGLAAGLILSTCWGFFVHSQMILPDMIVLAFSTAAGLALWRAVSDPPSPRAFVLFYAAVAFAMFAKGPVGLLPLAAAAAWLWTEDRWRGVRRLWHPLGVAVFVIITAAWVAPFLVLGVGSFAETVVVVDWLNRFPATPRPLAVANFLLDIIEGLVPWTLLVILAAGAARAHWRVAAVRFAALWAAVPLLVLLLVETPLERYALAIYPGAALLAAWWAFAHAGQRSRAAAITAWISLGFSAALVATILVGPSLTEHVAYIPNAWPRRIPLLAAAALMGAFLFWGLCRGRPRLLVYGVTASAALLLGYGNRVHAEWLNRTQDFKGLAARLERYAQGREARVYGGRFFQIDFYLGRPFLQIRTNEEFNRFVLGPDHPVVLIDEPRGWPTVRPTAPPEVGILDRMRVRGRDMLIVGIARQAP